MDEFEVKLKLLKDVLEKKNSTLEQILTITENQESVLIYAEEKTVDEVFAEMNAEKQKQIDEVLNADNVFQTIFDEIAPEFAERVEDYREIINQIQNGIKTVTELDLKIRLQEKQNNRHVSQGSKKKKIEAPKASKAYMLKQYNNHKKPLED